MDQLAAWPYNFKPGDTIGARATSQNSMGWAVSSTVSKASAVMVEVGPKMEAPRGVFREEPSEISKMNRFVDLEWKGAPGSLNKRFTYETYWNQGSGDTFVLLTKTLETFVEVKIVNPLGDHFRFKIRATETDKCPGPFSKEFTMTTEKPSCDCPKQVKTICPLPKKETTPSGLKASKAEVAIDKRDPEEAKSRGVCLIAGMLVLVSISII